MRTTRLFTTLTLTLLALLTYAQPRLTVVVVVDGMTQENLATLRPYWQAGGLRIMSEEAHQTIATFPHQVYGGQETMATLMTGTYEEISCPPNGGAYGEHGQCLRAEI